MSRKSVPHAYTARALRNLERRLERVAGRLRAVREQLDEDGDADELFIFHHLSMMRAADAAESFAQESEQSWDAYERGEPYTAESSKARSPLTPRKTAKRKKKATRKRE